MTADSRGSAARNSEAPPVPGSPWTVALVATVLVVGGAAPFARAVATAAAPAQVERVRYESDGLSARVIVMLSRVVPHEVRVLPGDPRRGSHRRIVIDLSNAQLGRAARMPIGTEHGILQGIRTGQFTARTVRVVLDLAGDSTHAVRAFTSPPRLVIDVIGKPGTVLARRRPAERSPDRPRAHGLPAPVAAPPGTRSEADLALPVARPRIEVEPLDDVDTKDLGAPTRPGAQPTASLVAGGGAEYTLPAPKPSTAGPVGVSSRELEAVPPARAMPVTVAAAPRADPEARTASATRRRAVFSPRISAAGAPWRIVLDPGHGGSDPGARGVAGLLEKDVVLVIARKVKRRLEQELPAAVLLTRDGDETRSLADRTAFANASRADLFVSIHANADDAGRLHGVETYTLNNSNDRATIRLANMENGPQLRMGRGNLSFILSDMVQSSKEEESVALAERIHGRLLGGLRARYPDVRNLGVKKGPFYVLVGAYMPCVLIETSFLTHPVEGKRLGSREYQADIAEGLYLGIRDFLAEGRLAKTL